MSNTVYSSTQVINVATLRRPFTLTAAITSGTVTLQIPHNGGWQPASGGVFAASGSINCNPSFEIQEVRVLVSGTATFTLHGK